MKRMLLALASRAFSIARNAKTQEAIASRAPSLHFVNKMDRAFCIASNATGGHRNPDPIRFSLENLKTMQRVTIETPTPISTINRHKEITVQKVKRREQET